MPREIIVSVYQYSELNDKAKEKARDWLISCWDGNDTAMVTESMSWRLQEAGYPTGDIQWSLGYCQGDGVAFYTGKGDYGDTRRVWLRRISRSWKREDRRDLYRLASKAGIEFKDVDLNIERNSLSNHYSHYNTMDPGLAYCFGAEDCTDEERSRLFELIAVAIEDLADDVRDMSKTLAAKGYEEIEYMRSKEYLEDAMEANEYEFTIEGKRYVG